MQQFDDMSLYEAAMTPKYFPGLIATVEKLGASALHVSDSLKEYLDNAPRERPLRSRIRIRAIGLGCAAVATVGLGYVGYDIIQLPPTDPSEVVPQEILNQSI